LRELFSIITKPNVVSFAGLSLVGIAIVTIHKDLHYPFTWGLLPTVGAALIIAAGPAAWFNRVALSNRLLVWIGLISFPLYLWHWPLISLAHIVQGETLAVWARISAILASVALAYVTYIWVERPVRFGTSRRIKTIGVSAAMLLIGCMGLSIFLSDGLRVRFGAEAGRLDAIEQAAGAWAYPGALKTFNHEGRQYLYQEAGRNKTLFLGDSNIIIHD
jgi:peptidoglycan/LPS O-acetylase OafA/YrhL